MEDAGIASQVLQEYFAEDGKGGFRASGLLLTDTDAGRPLTHLIKCFSKGIFAIPWLPPLTIVRRT